MKEVTYEDWQKNPKPRMMWVWNDDVIDKEKRKVVYIASEEELAEACDRFPVLTFDAVYKHCAEIEEKTRRMTNQELSWWLRDSSRREFKYLNDGFVYFEYSYLDNEDSTLIEDDILIRENGGEWREPLVEVEE